MKIVFLDMDGVMNTEDNGLDAANRSKEKPYSNGWWATMVGPDKVALLNRITSSTGAKIVWSSAWRYSFGFDLGRAQRFFLEVGIESELVGMTPRKGGTNNHTEWDTERVREILAWLLDNEDVSDFMVIDDVVNSDTGGLLKGRVVQPCTLEGLQAEEADKAINMLGVSP